MKLLHFGACVVIATASAVSVAAADALRIEAVMTPKDQIKLDFADGSRHFMLMVKREGRAAGTGPLAGAAVTEFGVHDIVPGVGGDPRGYLVFADTAGDIAYVKWQVRAIFVPGPDGKPALLDNGFWEISGGTGRFTGMKGGGTLNIKPAGPTDRRFILDGEVHAAK